MTIDKKIGISKKKKIMIPSKIQPIINTFRYLIILLPTSYKNNVLYYFSIYKIRFLIISNKKIQKFHSELIPQDI